MLWAVWLEGLAIVLGFFLLMALLRALAPRLDPDQRWFFSALAGGAASILARWSLNRLSSTSDLMKDLAEARRRPPRSTNFGKA